MGSPQPAPVRGDLTDYLRYQFEWGYAYNVRHGQDARILDTADWPGAEALFRAGDFWVLEGVHVVLCRYDEQGRPLGTVAVDAAGAAGYIAAAELAWQLGRPFAERWAAHPRYHRVGVRAG